MDIAKKPGQNKKIKEEAKAEWDELIKRKTACKKSKSAGANA